MHHLACKGNIANAFSGALKNYDALDHQVNFNCLIGGCYQGTNSYCTSLWLVIRQYEKTLAPQTCENVEGKPDILGTCEKL